MNIRKTMKRAMKDLTFFAEYAQESQQEQVFTDDLVIPMLNAILNPNRKDIMQISVEKLKKDRSRIVIPVRNERLFSLSSKITEAATNSAWELMPHDVQMLLLAGDSYNEKIQGVRKVGLITGLKERGFKKEDEGKE